MISVEAKKVGTRVIATMKVGIGSGQYTYTVQFADQGSEAANEAEARADLSSSGGPRTGTCCGSKAFFAATTIPTSCSTPRPTPLQRH
jgi:hypothetical protein